MSNPIPSSLALTNIPTGSAILSSTHDTNYSAIQSAVNEIIAALNSGVSGQQLLSAGGAALQWGMKVTAQTIASGPPASPSDGDIWIATSVDANGTVWQFRYNASETTYKWEFIGGPPIRATDGTVRSTTSTTFVDFGTPSPTLSIARAGDYMLTGSIHVTEAGTTAASAFADIAVVCSSGTADITEAFGEIVANSAASHATPVAKSRVTGVTASSTAKLQWLQSSNAGSTTANGDRAWIEVLPIRVI